jgi:putative SOS response-associated peptidase YedK
MCGRYAAAKDTAALVEEFEAVPSDESYLPPDYNVAPTKKARIVVDREIDGVPTRAIEVGRWGLVPSWAKDPSIGSRMINARAETVAEKPAFRSAFAKRRCLVPADGYYEWYLPENPDAPRGKGGKPLKQPFYIHPADGSSLPMAGLYEWWRDRSRDDGDANNGQGEAWLLTCTIITTNATDELGRIHDRMPMTVARDDWSAWLDPAVGSEEAAGLFASAASLHLETYPVSTLVNSVRNNGPELLAPLPESM